jgi:hypothetical protein
MNRERSKSNFVAFRSEELRVNSEEFWYAFLIKRFFKWVCFPTGVKSETFKLFI